MTTIVAVRKHGHTCIVADSMVCDGNSKSVKGQLGLNFSKLFFWENAIIGSAGECTWGHVFPDFLRSQKGAGGTLTSETLLESFPKLWREFRSTYLIETANKKKDSYISICRIIVATPHEIFKLAIEGGVVSNERVVSIGGGSLFAYGAVCAADSYSESSFEIAMTGVRAAAAWNSSTSAPFSGWQISETGKFTEFTEY